jgi:hypothetical protein
MMPDLLFDNMTRLSGNVSGDLAILTVDRMIPGFSSRNDSDRIRDETAQVSSDERRGRL